MHIVADLYAEVVGVVAQSRYCRLPLMQIDVHTACFVCVCVHKGYLYIYRNFFLTLSFFKILWIVCKFVDQFAAYQHK